MYVAQANSLCLHFVMAFLPLKKKLIFTQQRFHLKTKLNVFWLFIYVCFGGLKTIFENVCQSLK